MGVNKRKYYPFRINARISNFPGECHHLNNEASGSWNHPETPTCVPVLVSHVLQLVTPGQHEDDRPGPRPCRGGAARGQDHPQFAHGEIEAESKTEPTASHPPESLTLRTPDPGPRPASNIDLKAPGEKESLEFFGGLVRRK